VRMALGADAGQVVRMVLREGTVPVVVGIGLGLVGAWFSTGLVRAMLFGIAPTDPVTFAVIPLALLGLGIAASWIPARRATAVPPTQALRGD
jgi:putative ABC transport system permease protein